MKNLLTLFAMAIILPLYAQITLTKDLNFGDAGVAKLPEGHQLLTETLTFENGGFVGLCINSTNELALFKLDQEGNLKTDFGVEGMVVLFPFDPIEYDDYAYLILQENMYLVVFNGGFHYPFDYSNVSRYDQNGILDTSFGINGKIDSLNMIYNEIFRPIILLEDNSILLLKEDNITKYDVNGQLDTTYGEEGVQTPGIFPYERPVETIGNYLYASRAFNGFNKRFDKVSYINPNERSFVDLDDLGLVELTTHQPVSKLTQDRKFYTVNFPTNLEYNPPYKTRFFVIEMDNTILDPLFNDVGYVDYYTENLPYWSDALFLNDIYYLAGFFETGSSQDLGTYLAFDKNGTLQTINENEVFMEEEISGFKNIIGENDYFVTTSTNGEIVKYLIRPETMSITDINHADIKIYQQNQNLNISSDNKIESVSIFDLSGKRISTDHSINKNEFSKNINFYKNQILVIKVQLKNGKTHSKKILVK